MWFVDVGLPHRIPLFFLVYQMKIALLGKGFEVIIPGITDIGFDRFNKGPFNGREIRRFAGIEASLNRSRSWSSLLPRASLTT